MIECTCGAMFLNMELYKDHKTERFVIHREPVSEHQIVYKDWHR